MKTMVIAEAGVNHNGRIDLAMRLTEQAAAAGADFVKFQSFVTEENISRHAPKARYQIAGPNDTQTQFELVRQYELSPEAHERIYARCLELNIGFASTAFDLRSLELLARFRPAFYKVASGEITNLPLLRGIAHIAERVLLSTGMSTIEDIEAALKVLTSARLTRDRITVLQCNTEYPSPPSDANLRAMQTIGSSLGVPVGYSDHTLGTEISVAAVAMGASVIEKHLTLDRALPGPDHKASLIPSEFAELVRQIRNVESAMGDGNKRVTDSERGNLVIARKSLVASRPIRAGESFSELNVTAKRPGSGISPMRIDEILGRSAPRDFSLDEIIEL